MIQLHPLGRDSDGALLLAAHPEAETAGYRLILDDTLREFVGLDVADAGPSTDEAEAAPEPEDEPEPIREVPQGPIEVASPAEALAVAHGLWLVRMPPRSDSDDGDDAPVEGGDDASIENAEVSSRQPANDEISDMTLHDAVLTNLHRWNVRIPATLIDEGWWVTKLGDKAWQISFRFLSRGRIHEAEWVLDTDAARLVPENRLAEILAWVKADKPAKQRARRRRGGRGRGRTRQQTRKR